MTERAFPTPAPTPPVKTWFAFIMMCLGMFMAILDVQIVATSLPAIQGALKLEPDQMSWIQTAYLTAEVIAIPLTGWLTRTLSMRWLFVGAVLAFTLASLGCAASQGFGPLIGFRVVQGFSGGTLIPLVFAAVFVLLPARVEGLATTVAGVLAVLAPTVGPIVGGWITQTYSWHWLFLINVLPGICAAIGAGWAMPRTRPDLGGLKRFDLLALGSAGASLTALELGLKAAPKQGWSSTYVLCLIGGCAVLAGLFVYRSLRSHRPIVELRTFKSVDFTIGCCLSFILGAGLFGSVYLMPVFLAFVRGHGALRIGEIMLVTGVAQLVAAPLAVLLERHLGARTVTFFGFLAFSIGLGWSATQTATTDFDQMFGPQVVRGGAIMFCLLPPTRLALGRLETAAISDASALFNLMRNLGGAIGLALIDTVIFGRTPTHLASIVTKLRTGDEATAQALGIPLTLFRMNRGRPPSPTMLVQLRPRLEHLALTQAINEAWLLMSVISASALFLVWWASATPHNDREKG